MNFLCEDYAQAKRSRDKVKSKDDMQFYLAQANAVAQWQLGEPKPESVILGELPYVGTNHEQLDRE